MVRCRVRDSNVNSVSLFSFNGMWRSVCLFLRVQALQWAHVNGVRLAFDIVCSSSTAPSSGAAAATASAAVADVTLTRPLRAIVTPGGQGTRADLRWLAELVVFASASHFPGRPVQVVVWDRRGTGASGLCPADSGTGTVAVYTLPPLRVVVPRVFPARRVILRLCF